MQIKMRVARLDNGRYVVEFPSHMEWNAATNSYDNGDFWGSFEDQTQHATRKGAEDEMRGYEIENNRDRAAQQRYEYQYAYACGERD
jgi:hypothetical protein